MSVRRTWRRRRAETLRPNSSHEFCTQQLRLLKNEVRRRFLLVGRIPILSQNALDRAAELGTYGFLDGPVDRHVIPNALGNFACDDVETLVPEHFAGAFMMGQGIVRGHFFIVEAEL